MKEFTNGFTIRIHYKDFKYLFQIVIQKCKYSIQVLRSFKLRASMLGLIE